MIADFPDLLARRAALTPATVALEDAASGHCLTYAELDARAGRAAALLAARGVAEGDRVAVLTRNRPEYFELLFGCAKLGAVLVPLNWRMPPAELDGLIADAEPVLLLHGAQEAEAARGLAAPPPAVDFDGDYEALLAAAPERGWRDRWPAASTWYLLYTSGTTGRPKGVIYNFRMALANHVNIGGAIGLVSTDTNLAFLPIFHTAGINLHALPTLIAGGRVIVMDGFDADRLVALLEARRLDTLFAVPTVYQSLLDHPRFAAAPLAHVRHWGCGGAPLPDALALAYRDLGVRVCNGMGMTETGPTAFLVDPADAWDRIGSVGKPQLLCRARIVDTSGREAGGWRGRRPPVRGARDHPWLLAQPGGDPRRLQRRRLADLGRSRPPRRGGLLLHCRAAEGDVHLGRRERLSGRGRECAFRPSCNRRRGGACRGGPEMGRGGPRLRPAFAGRRPPGAGRAPGLLPRPPRPVQGAETLRLCRRIPAHLGRQDPEASADLSDFKSDEALDDSEIAAALKTPAIPGRAEPA
jgi:acyl-CoA synthetase (AMP-forming)/AMP-acid ligase II